MRALAIATCLSWIGCTSIGTCRDGTVFLTLQFDAATANADALVIAVTAGGSTSTGNVAHTPGSSSGSVEVRFPKGYPSGQTASIDVTATQAGTIVGLGSSSVSLTSKCAAVSVSVSGGGGGGADLSTGGLTNGSACANDAACATGFCVDGVCCDGACSGQCQACDVAGSVGTCAPVIAGAPHGSRTACTGAGTLCGGTCASGNVTTCSYPGATTACRSASCTSGVKTNAAVCDGAGMCPAPTTQMCSPATCNSGGTDCQATCNTDADCVSSAYCSASGTCVAQTTQGMQCNVAAGGHCKVAGCRECASAGGCVDGYCCNVACGGSCQACNVAGQLGTCAPAPAYSSGRNCTALQYCNGTTTTCTACAAPGAAAALHFVDPRGTNDTSHGGGYGPCGYKTITYALTQATGQLALWNTTYSAASGETMPIVLSGTQSLTCMYLTASPATIMGKGMFAPIGINVSIAFTGTQNQLYSCIVNGGGGLGYCIDVYASGTAGAGHSIDGDISQCGGSAIQVESNVGNLSVNGAKIHDSATGIFWVGTNSGGVVANNSFSNNSGKDIQCSTSDPGVTGNGNKDGVGPATCQSCGGCPF